MESITIMGVEIGKTSYEQLISWIEGKIEKQDKFWIATPNPEILLKAQDDPGYKEILNSADYRIADGVGLSVAAYYLKLKNQRQTLAMNWIGRIWLWKLSLLTLIFCRKKVLNGLPQISGDELFRKLMPVVNEKKWKIFLLGGSHDSALKCQKKLEKEFGIEVACNSGAKKIAEETTQDRDKIIEEINAFAPQILFVAYGAPWQEKWIYENLGKMKVNLAIGIGGTLDEYANKRITPEWMRQSGLRWLWRLMKEPRRVGRIWNAIVVWSWMNVS